MNIKIFCLMLVLGVIFSISSVCATDLNDTQVIPTDDSIQSEDVIIIDDDPLNIDVNVNDNSTENISDDINEEYYPYFQGYDLNLSNIGVLPLAMSYSMIPNMIQVNDSLNNTHDEYCINFTFAKPSAKNLTLNFDIIGTGDEHKQITVDIGENCNEGNYRIILGNDNEFSEVKVTITYIISYITNEENQVDEYTFEKTDFKPIESINI